MAHCTRKCLAAIGLLLLLSPGACVDPFAKTTTPAKYGTTTKSGTSQGKSAAKPASGDSAKTKGAKKKKKKDEQTYKQAWKLICNAEKLAKPDPNISARERNDAVAEWLVAHLTNEQARYWFIAFGKRKDRAEREVFFRAEAAKAGMKPCPFAEVLFAQSAAPTTQPAAAAPQPSGDASTPPSTTPPSTTPPSTTPPSTTPPGSTPTPGAAGR